jgi:serine/threonine protein phosphatase PrpC
MNFLVRIKSLFCFSIILFVSCSLVAVPGMELDVGGMMWPGRAGEDRIVASFLPGGSIFCAVCDGHDGKDVVNFVAENLHKIVVNNENFPGDIPTALTQAFLRIDEVLERKGILRSGTTAVVFIVTPEGKIIVANAGDSRGIVVSGGKVVLQTRDHKVSDPVEMTRILRAGGSICKAENVVPKRVWKIIKTETEGEKISESPVVSAETGFKFQEPTIHEDVDKFIADNCSGQLYVFVDFYTVCAVARALGDFKYKPKMQGQRVYWSSPKPDIYESQLQGTGDEFILLASDGFWDVVEHHTTNEGEYSLKNCIIKIQQQLKDGVSAQDVSRNLAESISSVWIAEGIEDHDDISVIVVVPQTKTEEQASSESISRAYENKRFNSMLYGRSRVIKNK